MDSIILRHCDPQTRAQELAQDLSNDWGFKVILANPDDILSFFSPHYFLVTLGGVCFLCNAQNEGDAVDIAADFAESEGFEIFEHPGDYEEWNDDDYTLIGSKSLPIPTENILLWQVL